MLRDAIIPRPIAWVSSIDAQGNTNIAPFSFSTSARQRHRCLGFSCVPRGEDRNNEVGTERHLGQHPRTREFVINLVPESMADEMVRTSDPLPPGRVNCHAG